MSPSLKVEPSVPDLEQLAKLDIPLTSPVQVTSYLNDHFPTDKSLVEGLDDFIANLESAQERLDTELTSLIRAHRHDTAVTENIVAHTDSSLTQLQTALSTLSTAATAAHAEIDVALAPATPVFTALRNVTRTSETIHALAKLDAAVIALEQAAQTADLKSLAADPSPFTSVTDALDTLDTLPNTTAERLRRLPSLRARAAVARETLRAAVLIAFKRQSDAVSHAADTAPDAHDVAVAMLRTACAVAEAMGADTRAEVVGAFVRRRRASLEAAFAMRNTGLVALEQRCGWVRRELCAHWARLGGERGERGWGRVFPDEWGVARRAADGLMAEMRDWVVATLDAGADRDVAVMVSALGKTKEFEVELDRRFDVQAPASFVGTISDCFGPWMDAYVQHEDRYLTSVLQELVRDETWTCENGCMLKSATELFLMIKKSMRTCASLDVRQPLFSLHRSFKKHLSSYAATLMRNLPGLCGNALGDSTSNVTDFDRKLRRACGVVNTAQYCSTTIEQLEQTLRKTVQEAYSEDIDMSVERERFGSVCAKGIQALVALVEEDLEGDVRTISERDWSSWSAVGDTSKYVSGITGKLAHVTKAIHEQLSSKQHFRFGLEKMASAFIAQVRRHVYKCEQVNTLGAQQLLLDVTTLKRMVVGLPASVHAATATTFLKTVNRDMGKVEAVLKVILAPIESCVDTYVALVNDGSAEDLQHVLHMRGLRRADAAPLVLDYSRRIGRAQRLKPVGAAGLAGSRDALGGASAAGGAARGAAQGSGGGAAGKDGNGEGGAQGTAVDSVRDLFGMIGSSLIDTGISGKLEQVSSQLESTTDRLKKEAVAARWSLFGK